MIFPSLKVGNIIKISWNENSEICTIISIKDFTINLDNNRKLYVIPENYTKTKRQPENFTYADETCINLSTDAFVEILENE